MTRWSAMPGAGYVCMWFSLGQAEPSGWPSPASCLSLPHPGSLQRRPPTPRIPQLPQEGIGLLHKCQVSEGRQLPGHGREVVSFQVPERGAE